jgi:hypothetical protein
VDLSTRSLSFGTILLDELRSRIEDDAGLCARKVDKGGADSRRGLDTWRSGDWKCDSQQDS